MDPVELRITAEVEDALKKVNKLRADYISFKDEYKKAVSEMAVVSAKFSGDQLTRTATQYLKVIQQLGGVQKLSAAEQAKVNKVLTEYSEKMQLLGRTVPETMRRIMDSTSQAATRQQADMKKAMDALSGDKVVQQANLYVQAIQKIGDANRLTDAQQQRVNKTLTEASEVYRRLGQQVPAEMQKILDATNKLKPAQDELKKLRDSLSGDALVRSAMQYSKVISELGGVTKLSAEEQKKFLGILDKLEAKYAAMGQKIPADLQRMQRELRNLAPATAEIQKLQDQLSGRTVISQANNYVEAIRRIGGATRLTADEQKKANAVLTEAAAKYRALGQQVPADMQHILNATQNATGKSRGFFNGLWFDIAKGSAVGNLVANAISGSLSKVQDAIKAATVAMIEFIKRGSEVDRVRSAFEKLIPAIPENRGRQASAAIEGLIEAGRRGLKGLANDFDIVAAANKAVLFGLPLTEKQFETLARASVTLGRAMNLNAGKALDDLIIALGRTSPRILDNLGIIVKVVEANDKYAASLGKTRLELSADERVIGFYTEAMRKMGIKVDEIGEIHLTAADKFQVAKVNLENIRDTFARLAAQSPVLNRAIEGVGEILLGALGTSAQQQVEMMFRIINTGSILAVKGFDAVLLAIQALSAGIFGVISLSHTFYAQQIKQTTGFIELLGLALIEAGKIPGILGQRYKEGGIELLKFSQQIKGALGDPKELDKQAKLWEDRGVRVVTTIEMMRDRTKKLAAELEAMAKKDPFAKLRDISTVPRIVNNDAANNEAVEGLTKAQEKLLKAQETFQIGWDKQNEKFREEQEKMAHWWDMYIQKSIAQGNKLNDAVMNMFSSNENKKAMMAFERTTGMLKQIDKLHYQMDMSWVEVTKKMGTFTTSIGWEPKKWSTFTEGIDKLANSFVRMMQIQGKAENEFGKFVSTFVVGIDVANRAGELWKKGLEELKGKGIDSVLSGIVNIGAAALTAAAQIMEATDKAGRANRALSGAASGAKIGASFGGGWGALIGAGIGALVGYLRNPAFEDIMKRTGHNWGVKISESLARGIAETAKKEFGGDRQAAEIFHFGDILEEAGGITDENFDVMLRRLRDVFSMVQTGKFSIKQARDILDANFSLFAEHLEKSGKLASKAMLEFIELNKQLGIESQAIRDFFLKNAQTFGTAIATMSSEIAKRYSGLFDEIEQAKKDVTAATEELVKAEKDEATTDEQLLELKKKLAEASEKLADLTSRQARGAVESQEEFERLGRLTVAAYNRMVAEGLSAEEIAERLGPAWSKLVETQKNLGIATKNAALQELLRLQIAREANPELFAAADAVNQSTVALHNMGGMSQEVFDDLQAQMQAYFTRLQATGLTQRQVLEQNLPFLRTSLQLQKEGKLVIDQTTQMYIDQARELGLLGEETETETGIMKAGFDAIRDGLAELIKVLGGDVPASLKRMTDAASDTADSVTGDFRNRIQTAGNDVNDIFKQVIDSAGGIGDAVSGAARTAVDGLGDIEDAARRAGDAVTTIAEGQSPGGFKGIADRSRQALREVINFANQSESYMQDLYDKVGRGNIHFDRDVRAMLPGPGRSPQTDPAAVSMETMKTELSQIKALLPQLRSQWSVILNGTVVHEGDLEEVTEKHITPHMLATIERGGVVAHRFRQAAEPLR